MQAVILTMSSLGKQGDGLQIDGMQGVASYHVLVVSLGKQGDGLRLDGMQGLV